MAFRLISLMLAVCAASIAHADRFRLDGTTLIYDSREPGPEGRPSSIAYEDVGDLVSILRANPDVTLLQLNSDGGGYFAAFDMADALIDFGVDTEVLDICASSCAYAFLGGTNRKLRRGGRIGFHQTSWSAESISQFYDEEAGERGWDSPFAMTSWNYGDTQYEVYERLAFMIRRGVDAEFAIETLRPSSDDMWYPYRAVLVASGFLTE